MAALPQCDAFGYIYDQAGDPAPDVLVTLKKVIDASGNSILLSPLTTLTDSAGSYHFTLPEDAAATIAARASGLWQCPDGRVFKVPPGPSGELIATFLLPGSSSVVPPLIYVSDTLSLPRSSASADGYLAAADFVRFDAATNAPVTVESFNLRTGAVVPVGTDYAAFYLSLGGGTLSGALTLAADPAAAMEAATRQYVDGKFAEGVSGVATFNGRTGAVLPIALDYASFYAPIVHTHNRSQITDLGVFSTSQPGLVPQPTSGDAAKVLRGDGTWGDVAATAPATARVTDYGASGSKLTFTGAINVGANTLTLTSGAHNFKVGQGIAIVGAGSLATVDVGSNLLVSQITAIAGAVITIADNATHTQAAAVVRHDDTQAIQNAINAISASGGGTVLFPQGYYRINKGFTDFSSILKIPNNPYNSPTVPLGLKAEAPPGYSTYAGGVVEHGCAILKTDLIGSAGASMISGGPFDNNAGDWHTMNNTCIVMDGLLWRSYDNPRIGGVDLIACGNYTVIRDVVIDTDTPLLTPTQPTFNTIALRLPGNSTSILIECSGVAIYSYGVGIVASECVEFNNTIIMQCMIGLQLVAGYHLLTGRFLIWHCPTVIHVTPAAMPKVMKFEIDVEQANVGGSGSTDPPWTEPLPNHSFYDPSDLGVGKIDYIAVQGYTGAFQDVGYTGMSRVTQTNLGGPTKYAPGPVLIPNLQSSSLAATNITSTNGQTNVLTVADLLKLYDGSAVSDVSFDADNSAGSGYRGMRVPNLGVVPTTERGKLWSAGAGIEAPFSGANVSLNGGLVSYWTCNEASGPMADSVGSYNLGSVSSNPTSALGQVNGGRSFTGGQWAGNGAAALLSPGNTSFTIACWIYLTDISANHYMVTKTGGFRDEYILSFDHTAGLLQWTIQTVGPTYTTQNATSFGTVPLNTWLFVVASYDLSSGRMSIQVNNGVVDSTAAAPLAPVSPTDAAFYAGTYAITATPTLFFEGRLDAIGYWSRTLT